MIPDDSLHLFVYGTLRRASSHPMARFLEQRADYLGSGRVAGRLYHLGRYPGLVPPENPEDWVVGDIFRARENGEGLLARLDLYENGASPHPATFERAGEKVLLVDGREITAWLYWFRGPVHPGQHVPDGDYEPYLRRK